jgi:flagellar biosynthesis component FlhA
MTTTMTLAAVMSFVMATLLMMATPRCKITTELVITHSCTRNPTRKQQQQQEEEEEEEEEEQQEEEEL